MWKNNKIWNTALNKKRNDADFMAKMFGLEHQCMQVFTRLCIVYDALVVVY